ncbi:hypothetical protein Amal_01737 [Acetobacter malorum]|uniref:Uncharacterized protein n=1 Tax=Acetobacter malorum TaxID=178901 RepID=A0A177G8I0_9PROT|nr:hypothetical protein [Acetobacter malorum]OAG75967.1 hypothetical protein Amal_01737 [Acetobacter malorum]
MASEVLDTEFLCDILYTDRERLSSYLAQIDPNGVITGYKTSTTDSSSMASMVKGSAAVASASITGNFGNQDFAERTFDPAGALPIEVMNRLDEAKFIHRSAKDASIGSLVLVNGSISLRDFSQFIYFWPIIRKAVPWEELAAEIPIPGTGASVDGSDLETSAKALLDSMPHPAQMTIKGSQGGFWSTLSDSSFTVSAVDLFLKHKKSLSGEWFVLGILDGKPLDEEQEEVDSEDNMLDKMHDGIATFRSLFGRPKNCYGISPLVIFRKAQKVN